MDFISKNFELRADGTFHISNLTASKMPNPDVEFLRELADDLQLNLPEYADRLREIAKKLV